MGLSHAAAGGIIFIAAAMGGFQLSDDAFDAQDASLDAWREYHAQQRFIQATSFTIDQVKTTGGTDTEIIMTNTGSTNLVPEDFTVLLDGAPVAIDSTAVDNGEALWLPGLGMTIFVTHAAPSSTVVIDGHGVKEVA